MSDLLSLAADMASMQRGGALPPVEKWNPAYCGDIDLTIRRDGLWVHEGSPIGRPRLVRLFSTVLKREGDEYFLVTPVEKLKITVEDTPFLAVAMSVEGEGAARIVRFRTNVGDEVIAGPDHKVVFRKAELPGEESAAGGEALVPYIDVRAGLMARLSRPVWYDFAALLEGEPPVFRSAGVSFPYTEEKA